MNFWHMQLHEDNINWQREEEVLEKVGYIGMGVWTETKPSNPQQTNFEHTMKIGDIVAIRRGAKWIALIRVLGKYELLNDEQTTELGWFKRRRQVEVLDWHQPDIYSVEKCGNHQPTLSICASSTADTTINIKKWYEKVMSENQINEVSELLKYKHQVILQGPPGTGKTRLAKLVAKQLTQTERKGTPQEIIDSLVKSFDTQSNEAKLARTKNDKLLSRFYESFPQDKLSSLSLPEYAIGHGDQDSLCWWLEVGLESLGRFSPGFSNNYPIYWSKSNNRYMLNNKVAGATNAQSAMELVSNELSKLIQKTDLDDSIKFFGPCFALKLLHSYFPDEYFPINSVNALNNALKLLGSYDKKMGTIEKNIKLKDIYLNKRQLNTDLTLIEFASIIWDNFNLKEGEELSENDEVMTHGEFEIIQFHPAYTYEDFVRGIVVKTNDAGNISYEVENKILAEFAKKATENPNGKYVLIIDEINRANLPSVLGELIYALEYRGENVESIYKYGNTRDIKLPKNLYIIGTMNTADRSVGHIDYAIRRRFAFYDVLPSKKVIVFEKATKLFESIEELFKGANARISSDFDANDVQLGHSYFLPSKKDISEESFYKELSIKLKYEIKPILYEYIKDGVLLDSAREVVENLHV